MAKNETRQFLYHFLPGDRPELATDPESCTEEDNRIGSEHFAGLEEAAGNGTVVMAGRSQDGVGPAIVIVEVASERDARLFMEADPFVTSGLFGARLHPFRIAL